MVSYMMHFRMVSSHRRQKDPRITITNRGQFSVNTECYESFFKEYPYIVLFYDAENRVIGFKPTKELTDNVYPIRLTRDASLVTISGTAFLKRFGIQHEVSRSYTATWDEKYGLVKIDLREKGGGTSSGDKSGTEVRGENTN